MRIPYSTFPEYSFSPAARSCGRRLRESAPVPNRRHQRVTPLRVQPTRARRPTASRVLDDRRRRLGQLAEQTGHASPGDGFDGPLLHLPGAHGDGDALDGVLPRALLPFVAPSLTSRRLPPRAALLRSARIEPRGARPAAG